MNEWDVIVTGAGPAGSTAARICAEKGLKVLLIDKEDFPRDKPCGGGLSVSAVKELDIKIPDSIIEKTCYGMRSIYKGKVVEIQDKKPVAYMIKRVAFDNFLFKKAKSSGAAFIKCKCKRVTEYKNHVSVETDKGIFDTEICIGADGFFSRTASSVRDIFTSREIRFCLVSHIPLSKNEIEKQMKSFVELDYGYINMGYAWLFPKSDCISAGIGGSGKKGRQLKIDFVKFLKQHGLRSDIPVQGCYIPVSRLKHPVCTKRIMLTGDAAGFVDCFSGEGINSALISGRIAAETASEALKNRGKLSVLHYKKEISSSIVKHLRWALRISDIAFKAENLFFGTLLFNKKILKKYFSVMRGDISYKRFFFETAVLFPFILLSRKIERSGDSSPHTAGRA